MPDVASWLGYMLQGLQVRSRSSKVIGGRLPQFTVTCRIPTYFRLRRVFRSSGFGATGRFQGCKKCAAYRITRIYSPDLHYGLLCDWTLGLHCGSANRRVYTVHKKV